MIDRKDLGSWLDGPPTGQTGSAYPGERLGLPRTGPGSLARFPRRLVAVSIDWLVACLIAAAFAGYRFGMTGPITWAPLLILLVLNVLLVGTLGTTIGHRLLGMHVVRVTGGYAGAVPGIVRSVLLCLGFPALVMDQDQRGLHDRFAGTMLIRSA